MFPWKLLVVATLAVPLTGCLTTELTRRYASYTEQTVAKGYLGVRVSAFVLTPPQDGQKATTIANLSDRGQAALVKAMAAKEPTSADLATALAQPIAADRSPSAVIDHTTFQKRVVISVEEPFGAQPNKITLTPADRISKLLVILKLADNAPARFTSWNRFDTQYETVDLGKVSLGHKAGIDFSLSAGPKIDAQTPRSGTLSLNESRELQEEVNLRRRYVSMSGILRPKRLRIYQEGATGIDLAGNIAIDVDIRIANALTQHLLVINRLSDPKGEWLKPESVKVGTVEYRYPPPMDFVNAQVAARYVLRHVTEGDKTITESDDDVTFETGRTRDSCVTLLRSEDLRARVYRLLIANPSNLPHSEIGYELQIHGAKLVGPVYFATYSEAKAFLTWLKHGHYTTVGHSQLFVGRSRLLAEDVDKLTVSAAPLNYGQQREQPEVEPGC